jgi:transposase
MSQSAPSAPTVQELQEQLAAKDAYIAQLQAQHLMQVAQLLARIEELERRLGLNSTNSSKPPSSDGLRRPNPVSLRVKGKKPSGGQIGHQGGTLKQVAQPDAVVIHQADQCPGCGADLSRVAASTSQTRQVFDLPIPRLQVSEHQVHTKQCQCGCKVSGQFPADVRAPAQYGPHVQALAVYYQDQQFLPEDRLEAMFADVFKLSIRASTLRNMARRFAAQVGPTVQAIYEKLRTAEVKHLDETGFRVTLDLQWMHVLSNAQWTHYRIDPKRGAIPQDLIGTVVHDHFKPYYTVQGLSHALCGAHHLRELKSLEQIEKESWAKAMGRLLRLACHWSNLGPVAQDKAERINAVYDRLVQKGLAFHEGQPSLGGKPKRGRQKKRIGHNLLIRLRDYKADALRFMFEAQVPFTNNQAEQDIRMMKVQQKISGGFRSQEGAQVFATIRSFLSTARKQAVNVFDAVMHPQRQPFYAGAPPACAEARTYFLMNSR